MYIVHACVFIFIYEYTLHSFMYVHTVVSVRVQKWDVYSHPDLVFRMYTQR